MEPTHDAPSDTAHQHNLFELIGDLAGAGFDLAQNTAQLAACEARVVVRRLAVRTGLFFAFLVVAATGLLLMLGGLALLLEHAAGMPAWLSFVLVGFVTLAGGAFFAWRMIRRLGEKDIAFPATIAELQADSEAFAGATQRRIREVA